MKYKLASTGKRILAASVDIFLVAFMYWFVIVVFGEKYDDHPGNTSFKLTGFPALLLYAAAIGYFLIPRLINGQPPENLFLTYG